MPPSGLNATDGNPRSGPTRTVTGSSQGVGTTGTQGTVPLRSPRLTAASKPARSSNDFPLPEGPNTATNRPAPTRSSRSRVSASRPKNSPACSTP